MPIEGVDKPVTEVTDAEPKIDIEEQDEQENPLWNKQAKDVKKMWERKEISDEQAHDFVSINLLKQKGLVGMKLNEVAYAFERGHINKVQATAYIQMNNKEAKPVDSYGSHILAQLSYGRTMEEAQSQFRGMERPAYGPDDVIADAFTGFMWSGIRFGGKFTAKKMFKEATRDVAIGAGVGVGMASAAALGAGPVVELLTGFMTPLGALAFMKMSKSALSTWVKQTSQNNPDLIAKLRDAAMTHTDDPQLTRMADALIRQEMVTIKGKNFPDFITGPEIAAAAQRNFTTAELHKIHTDAVIESKKHADIFKESRYKNLEAEEKAGRFAQRGNGAREVMEAQYKAETGAVGIEEKPFKAWLKSTIEPPKVTKKTIAEAAEDVQKAHNVFNLNKDTGELEITADLAKRFEDSGLEGVELLELIQREWGTFSAEARGEVTWATDVKKSGVQLQKLANLTGGKAIDVQHALGFAGEIAAQSKELRTKARALFTLFGTYEAQVSKMAKSENIRSFEDEMRVIQHINNLGSMSQAVLGVRAEYGRCLNMLRSDAEPFMKSNWDIKSIPNKQLGDIERAERMKVQDAIQHFRNAKTPKERINRAKSLQRNPILMGILEAQQAALLSHWKTQAVNLMGSSYAFINRTYAQSVATGIDAWMKADSWRKPFSFETTRFNEMRTYAAGINSAMLELFRLPLKEMSIKAPIKTIKAVGKSKRSGSFWRTLWSGQGQIDPYVQKWTDETKAGIIPDLGIPKYKKTPANVEFMGKMWQWKGTMLPLGTIIRTPFNGLVAGDEIFKTLNYHVERNKLLFRNVYGSGPKNWDAVKSRMATLMDENNPAFMDIHYGAKKSMRYETFTSDLDNFTRYGEKALNTPYIGPVMKLTTMPFYKVVVNLPKYALQQTPLGALAKWQRDALSKGGAERYEILARWALGSTMLVGAAALYENGMITGRQPHSQREAWKNNGIQPYAYLQEKPDGSKSTLSYGQLDPPAFLMGIGADLAQAYDLSAMAVMEPEAEIELNEIVLAWLTAFTEPLMSKTILTSASDTIKLVTEPDRMNIEKWGIKQVEKFIPRAFDMYNEVTDKSEYIYEVQSLMDAWYKKLNADQARKKRHSVYGTPVKRTPRWMGVLNKMDVPEDPVMAEMMLVGANQVKFPKTITRANVELELTPDERDDMIDIYASLDVKEALLDVIENPGYQSLKVHEARAKLLKGIITIYRKAAADIYLGETELKLDELKTKLRKKANQYTAYETTPSPDAKLYKMLDFIR